MIAYQAKVKIGGMISWQQEEIEMVLGKRESLCWRHPCLY